MTGAVQTVLARYAPAADLSDEDASRAALARIQAQHLIIDVHEHLESARLSSKFLRLMDELGIGRMCLMGSSQFTLTMNERVGFTGYDENNSELLASVKAHPGRFEAWATVNPGDPGKLEKFIREVDRGATGLKLYLGHGYVTRRQTYMFHTLAMDDPGMLPLYAYCQERFIPLCIHVNPYAGKPGFAEELIAVLTAYPNMKVNCPHFMLSSIRSSRLEEFLDTFPNLYTDISFGDSFAATGLTRISNDPQRFQRLFARYPERIMFGTDLVLTSQPGKTEQWVREQTTAYLEMLSRRTYTTPVVQGQTLNGLALSPALLERVLYKNYLDFSAKQPSGTVITRRIDFARLGVDPTGRSSGQTFPPPAGAQQLSG
jgi:predicted TIM-barrel fold metal-dependent hydrolase